MTTEQIHRMLGKALWDIAGVEDGAGTACGFLARSPYLTDAERGFVRERMWREERGHERLMACWATRSYGPRPRRAMPYAAAVWRDLLSGAQLPPLYRFAYSFATLQWNEVNTLRSAREIAAVLGAVEPAAALDFRQIEGEEAGHVAWGRGVRARLEREAPAVWKIAERYLELTGLVYPAVINRSRSRTWARLRVRLALD